MTDIQPQQQPQPPPPPTVAVLYATTGGMGDVGKFAVALATKRGLRVRPVALCFGTGETDGPSSNSSTVDVEDTALKDETEAVLEGLEGGIPTIDVAAGASADRELEGALGGATSVVSCLGNRQPGMERWCEKGTRAVLAAMKASGAERLVCLSSMGIGRDFLKTTPLTCLWAAMLRTVLRSARRDLSSMEDAVRGSGLDYLLVRPVGLTPSEPPRGSCDVLLERGDHGGRLAFMLSKQDAAGFLLEEALSPTLRNRAVTIGYAG